MSAVFEGILISGTANSGSKPRLKEFCTSRLSGIRIGYAPLDDEVTAIVRVGDRNEAFSEKFDELGAVLSSTYGKALVVRYDSRIGHRSSTYFEAGAEVASFGEKDEIYSPLKDDGSVTGTRITFDKLDDDEEYETIENAIELGLNRLAMGTWEDLRFMIYNQEDLVL